MVVAAEIDFLLEQEKAGAKLAVLEIPLLFETGADARVDVTVVVSAPTRMQRAARAGAARHDRGQARTSAGAAAARRRAGRARADYVVDSGVEPPGHARRDR